MNPLRGQQSTLKGMFRKALGRQKDGKAPVDPKAMRNVHGGQASAAVTSSVPHSSVSSPRPAIPEEDALPGLEEPPECDVACHREDPVIDSTPTATNMAKKARKGNSKVCERFHNRVRHSLTKLNAETLRKGDHFPLQVRHDGVQYTLRSRASPVPWTTGALPSLREGNRC